MNGFLAYYWNIMVIGTLYAQAGEHTFRLPYNVRKLSWEMAGGLYLIYRLVKLYLSHPHLLDLPSNILTCVTEPEAYKLVVLHTAWYMYSTTYQAYSLEDTGDNVMMIHHMATIFLLMFSEHNGYIVETLALLFVSSISNPLLQLSKLLNYYNNPLKSYVFMCFSIVFFAMRIMIFPTWILNHTIIYYWPYIETYYEYGAYITANSVMLGLYGLQWVWLWNILRILISVQR